jgi:copper chaperone CopZ
MARKTMKRLTYAVLPVVVFLAAKWAFAEEPPPASPPQAAPTRATFLITGLHCPPCTRTVESALRRAKGVQSVAVDWNGKSARVVYDERTLPASRLAGLIATTPHMMGGNMRYNGWLSLRVPSLRDEASAQAAKEALNNVEGVSRVVAYPSEHAVGVQFARQANVSSQQLIEALTEAGMEASNL